MTAGLALLMAACQPMPQPFQPEQKTGSSELLSVSDAGGIVVRDIAGMPEGGAEALADAMLAGLQRLDVPATRGSYNRRSLFLDAKVETRPLDGDRIAIEIDWRLLNGAGKLVGDHHATAALASRDWGATDSKAYAKLADGSVPGIVALVRDPNAVAAPERPPSMHKLYVWPVAGAPGNGGPALSRAMGAALSLAKVPVTDKIDDALVIAGSVTVRPPEKGRQKVEVVWTVLDPNGGEIAKLAQANAVTAGTLDGDWGELARIIADAAAPGVVDLLRQLPESAIAPAARGGG